MMICRAGFILLIAFSVLGFSQDDVQIREASRCLKAGEFQKALGLYEKLLVKDPGKYSHLVGAGQALFHLGESARSRSLFVRAQRNSPDAAIPVFFQARILEREARGRMARDGSGYSSMGDAAILYREAASLSGQPREALKRAALCHETLGDYERAMEDIGACLRVGPGDADSLFIQARISFAAGDYDVFLKTTANLVPNSQSKRDAILAWKLESLALLRRIDTTREYFFELLASSENADRGWPYTILARAWGEEPFREEWKGTLQLALQRHPGIAHNHFYLGALFWLEGELDSSLSSYQRYVDARPEDPVGYLEISRLQIARGDVREADAFIREALSLNSTNQNIRNHARVVVGGWVEQKDFKQALALHLVVQANEPEDLHLRRGHAILLKELGQLEESVEILKDVIGKVDPQDERRGSYINDLALGFKGLKRIDESEKWFRIAAEEYPFAIDAQENLGVLLFQKGELREAAKRFMEVLSLEPGRLRSRYYMRQMPTTE